MTLKGMVQRGAAITALLTFSGTKQPNVEQYLLQLVEGGKFTFAKEKAQQEKAEREKALGSIAQTIATMKGYDLPVNVMINGSRSGELASCGLACSFFLFGIAPYIVLHPDSLDQLSKKQLRAVLEHEVLHFKFPDLDHRKLDQKISDPQSMLEALHIAAKLELKIDKREFEQRTAALSERIQKLGQGR